MAEIVNLRSVRKRKAREEKERQAGQNRVRHGQSKADRVAAQSLRDRETTAHEAHRREAPPPDGEER